MHLLSVEKVQNIHPDDFKRMYYNPMRPLVIKDMAKEWAAFEKWNWDLFKAVVGDVRVGVYNNIKSDAYTAINTADDYMLFGDYIEMVRKGPAAWRIFLFNIFDHAPQLITDFAWPEQYATGFVKRYPMLFVG